MVRVVPPPTNGPPRDPFGFRVSMTRHGATVSSWRGEGDEMTKGKLFDGGPVEFATVICPVPWVIRSLADICAVSVVELT